MSNVRPQPVHVLTVHGLKVEVTWKRVKRLSLTVTPSSQVRVSCPPRTREGEVIAFVASREGWIRAALERQASRAADTRSRLTGGDAQRIWGVPTPLLLEPGTSTKARLVGNTLVISVTSTTCGDDEAAVQARRAALRALLAEELRAALPDVVEKCERVVGKHATLWRVRYMTSRWGSCNTRTGAITINSALATESPRCLEGVVTHELCHLWDRRHDARFHSLMDGFFPGWREARAELRANPPLLR
jgi:predicted metal-dependent hydrolase